MSSAAIILAKEPHTWREKRDGSRRYVGQVLRLTNRPKKKTVVVAEVYGDTEVSMLRRRDAVLAVLKKLGGTP